MQTREEEHIRLPGLYLPWNLPDMLQIGGEYRIEAGAETIDGATLVAIYHRVASHDAQEAE